MSTDQIISKASVATDRSARYGKQLASHLGHRYGGEWDEATGKGWIDLNGSRATLAATDSALDIELTTRTADVTTLEDVVGRHLVRFAGRDRMTVEWQRSDGSPGTSQNSTDE